MDGLTTFLRWRCLDWSETNEQGIKGADARSGKIYN